MSQTKLNNSDINYNTNVPGSAIDTNALSEATTTTKGVVERATDAEVTAGTDTTRYVSAKQVKDNYIGKSERTKIAILPGATLKYSADAERIYGEHSYTKRKEIKLNIKGDITVSFDITRNSNQTSVNGRVYINGSPVGIERVETGAIGTYATYTQNFTVNSNNTFDLIQLYTQAPGTGNSLKIRNFRISYTDSYEPDGVVIQD